MRRIIYQSLLLIFLCLVYYSDIDATVCYACMCMDVCVVFYDCPVGEIHVVIQNKKDIEE